MLAEGPNELIKVMLKELLKTISISVGVILGSHVVLYLFSKLSIIDRYYPFEGERTLFLIIIAFLIVLASIVYARYRYQKYYREGPYVASLPLPLPSIEEPSDFPAYRSDDARRSVLGDLNNQKRTPESSYNTITLVYPLFFLVFALALLYLIYRGFLVLIGNGFFLRHNLLFTAILVFAILQFTLRKSRYENQSWKKLTDVWLKLTSVSTLSTGGFGLLGLQLKDTLYAQLLKADFVDIGFLGVSYVIVVLFVGTAHLLITVGKASSSDEYSREPKEWFVPSYATVWIGCFGMHTLFFNGLFLTLYAYMTSS